MESNGYLIPYDLKIPTKYITYLDQNNLNGYAMWKSLPMGGCKWLNPAKFNRQKYDDNSFRGCVLEVDH